MKQQSVIFLNGNSCSGKTSTALALQVLWDEPTLYAPVDSFRHMLPQHILIDREARRTPLASIIDAFLHSLPHILNCGYPVIIDYVLGQRSWIEKMIRVLDGHHTYFINLTCPLEILEQREKQRGGKRAMGVRAYHNRAFHIKTCDLEIDSSAHDPEERARIIIDFVQRTPHPQAFEKLKQALPGDPV